MSLRAYWGASVGLSLMFASSLSHAQCTKDTDCKGERVCEAGQCVDPPAPVAPAEVTPPVESPPPAAAADPSAAPESREPQAATSSATTVPPAYEPPAAEPQAPLKGKRHSAGMMTTGIVMVAVAPVALLAALLANSKQSSCETSGSYFGTGGLESYESDADCGRYDATIYGGSIGGLALLAVGIPLIVIGGKREKTTTTARVSPWATTRAAGFKLHLDL